MMGQHYLSQPAKVPFIQQQMMMAQNPMLQHQMQNMSLGQHESHHHLSAQNATALINEINGMCVIEE